MLTDKTKVFSFFVARGIPKVLWFKGNIAVATRAPLLGALQKEGKASSSRLVGSDPRAEASVVGPLVFGAGQPAVTVMASVSGRLTSHLFLPASSCLAGRHQYQTAVAS